MVLQEKTKAPKSAAIETLGSYNPHLAKREDQIQCNAERIQYWLTQGAQPSNTVHNLLIELGLMTGKKKRSVFTKKAEPVATAETVAASAPVDTSA